MTEWTRTGCVMVARGSEEPALPIEEMKARGQAHARDREPRAHPPRRARPLPRRRPWLAAPLALLLLAGCTSTESDPERDALDEAFGRESPRIELGSFEHDWEDIDSDDRGVKNSYEVARFVTERHNAALRCLSHEPPAHVQARELLEEVLLRVPDTSRSRRLLAQLYFNEAAYWFRTADVIAWEMQRLKSERTAPQTVAGGGELLDEEEIQRRLKEYQPFLQRANDELKASAARALREHTVYRQQRPDDKSVIDSLWKLHFYLQDYPQALKWLDYELKEFDLAEVPEEEPLRQEYADIRKLLREYLAEVEIEGGPGPGGVLQWDSPRRRAARKRLYDYTPRDGG